MFKCSSVWLKLLLIWETNAVSPSQVQFWRAASWFSLLSQPSTETRLSSSVEDTSQDLTFISKIRESSFDLAAMPHQLCSVLMGCSCFAKCKLEIHS